MAKGWTLARRRRQAVAIRKFKPWLKSTGPKTPTGKSISSQNALQHGLRSAEFLADRKRTNDVLREARAFIKRYR